MFGKFGIHLENVEEVITMDLVKVAVGQRADIATRLTDGLECANVLAKHVVLA